METILGVVGKDFVMVLADKSAARSILAFKHDEDKISKLDEHKVVAACGETADRTAFTEYVQRNMALDEFRTGLRRTTDATAHFIRGELATALRKSPYYVSLLLAGFDDISGGKAGAEKTEAEAVGKESKGEASATEASTSGVGPSLYWMDYLGTMQRVNYGAHGYAAFFSTSTMDRYWKPGMTEEEAADLLATCVAQLKTRFIIHQPNFTVRVVSASGVKDVELPTKVLPDLSAAPKAAAGGAGAAVAVVGGGSAGAAPMET